MQSDGKKIVRANVLALIDHASKLRPGESGVTRLKNLGIAQGTAQRVLDETSDVRLETLDQLAEGLKVQPWQLLVPAINPVVPPTLADKTDASLLGEDVLAALGGLSSDELLRATNALRAMLGLPVNTQSQGAQSGEFRPPKASNSR